MEKVKLHINAEPHEEKWMQSLIYLVFPDKILYFTFVIFRDSHLDMRIWISGDESHFNSSEEDIASKCDFV